MSIPHVVHPLLCKCETCTQAIYTVPVDLSPDPIQLGPPNPTPPPRALPSQQIIKPQRRVKSLAAYIRKKTQSSREVARFMVDVMRDDSQHMNHRMEAAKWLVDRTEGKAVERSVMVRIEGNANALDTADSVTPDQLEALIRDLQTRQLAPQNPTQVVDAEFAAVETGTLDPPIK